MTTLTEVVGRSRYATFVNNSDYAGALESLLEVGTIDPDQALWHWNGIINELAVGAAFDINGVPVADPTTKGANGLSAADVSVCRDTLSKMTAGYQTLDALLSTGCQLSSPIFQGTVAAMEGLEPPEAVAILEAILAIGRPKSVVQWVIEGLTSEPTLEEVGTAISQLPSQIHKKLTAAWTATSNADADGRFNSIDEAIAFFTDAMKS